ncbi:uncharacterized protein [Physcomitrium patens]|uniref:Uncharacterized protein n=1 Tax=Physcomitrium patens TaxID=3218 RepID=A0A7I4FSV9_PHYPA|nr:uncharacterized protein LOC112284420 isoform X2 [Physcomitrium patens]|eukprot:XP_024379962.1 uncharacterized protein LOC112284420 isoform X2 [Physcomitrella patens]
MCRSHQIIDYATRSHFEDYSLASTQLPPQCNREVIWSNPSVGISRQMNFYDEEEQPRDKKGKRSICVVDEQRPINNLKAPGDVLLRPPVSSDQRRPAEELCTLAAAVIDNFGAVNVLPTDKFGAVHWYNNQSSSFGSTYSQRFETAEESIGSINVQGDNKKLLEDVRGKYHLTESGSFSVNESGWGRNNPLHSTSAGTSNPCSSRVYDGSYSNSITHICPLDEQTPDDKNENDEDGGNESGGPPLKRFCASSRYNVQEKRTDKRHVHFLSPEPISADCNELLQSSNLRHNFDTRTISPPTSHVNIGYPKSEPSGLPSASSAPPLPHRGSRKSAQSLDLNELPKPSVEEDSRSSLNSFGSDDGSVREIRSNYKFASIGRQAYLRERMEERQKLQDATPASILGLPETHGAERCRYVVAPEDLVWLNIRHYCGMVLDLETRAVLGTAVLFIPNGSNNRKSSWVTSVNTVEGRWEVAIKDCEGEIQLAKLMLTSTAFGLAFFSVRPQQKTFALAFLSIVAGPTRLSHQLFVDANRGDQVYVFGYEEPWESEAGRIADVRVRPGRIIEAGNMEIVEIDFTKGRLGGSITTPSGFSGGLVTRSDGLWIGVITGQTVEGHSSLIDFSSAYNVHSLLDEL